MNGHGAVRVRRDVQSLLAEGDSGRKVIEDYGRAVAKMRERDNGQGDPSDPLSWRFQAAIHGYAGVDLFDDHPGLWSTCRHATWFFLPWHRLYLYFFERMIQFHLEDETWSLPYWDYSKRDAAARVLPEPFRVPQAGNPLHTSERDPGVNSPTNPTVLPFATASALGPVMLPTFALPPEDPAATFGGGMLDNPTPAHDTRGAVDRSPHGSVHVFVGGESGWMRFFDTAGLDPIFWLHHANVDRLWDVWIEHWGTEALPSDQAWLETEFEFFDVDGQKKRRAVGELLDSAALGYAYESVALPESAPERPPILVEPIRERVAAAQPELLGAREDVSFQRRVEISIPLQGPPLEQLRAAAAAESAERWYLRVEDVRGQRPGVPGYDVYVELPPNARLADHPELRAGSVASFGVFEASQPGGEHGGIGLTDVFDVTDQLARLYERGEWTGEALTVTVAPLGPAGDEGDGGDVRAGRISVYVG